MDLSSLSDAELEGIASGDMSKLSDATLEAISSQPTETQSQKQATPAQAPAQVAPTRPSPQPLNPMLMGSEPSFVPQSQQEAEQFSSGFKQGIHRSAPNVVRYGVPLAAAVATAPAGGVGFWPAAAITSGIGAGSSLVAEAGAQAIEKATGQRDEFSGREMAAQTVLGATPFLPVGGAKSAVPSMMLLRGAGNIASAVGTTEAARAIRGEERDLSKWIAPVAFAGGFTALNEAGAIFRGLGSRAKAISDERFGGAVMLTDVVPELARLERSRLQRGSATARKALEGMEANVADALVKAFPDVPGIENAVTKELAPMVGRIQELKNASAAADTAFQQAKAAADDAVRFGRPERAALLKDAQAKALEVTKQKIIEKQAIDQFFGGIVPDLESVSTGAQQRLLGEIADAAKTARKEGLGKLYDEAGIGLNDPVVTIADVTARIQKMSKEKGNAMQGNEARARAMDLISKAFSESPDGSTLTREALMDLRDKIATNLKSVPGADVRRAEKQAQELYAVVKDASNDFIKANMSDKYDAYVRANDAAASLFRAGDSDLINAIKDQSPAQVVQRIRSEGVGKSLKEIDGYVSALENLGPEYAPVAAEFRKVVNNVVRAGIIDEVATAGTGWAGTNRPIDFPALAQKIESLAEKGYPVDGLGFGTRKEIKELARVSSALGKGGITIDEVQQFVQQSPVIGAQAAAARLQYSRALRQQIIDNGLGRKSAAASRLNALARQARMNADDVQKALRDAQNDPVAQLLNETRLNLSKDPVKNTKFTASLSTLPPETVRDFVKAMETSPVPGRKALLDQIRVSATANVMRDILEPPSKNAGNAFNQRQFMRLFSGMDTESVTQRRAFKELIGQKSYDELIKNFVSPLGKMIDTQAKLGAREPQSMDFLKGLFTVQGMAQGKATSGLIRALGVISTIRAAEQPTYYTFYKMFADPETAPKFARVGYSAERIAQQPELAGILKVSQMRDRLSAEEESEPSP